MYLHLRCTLHSQQAIVIIIAKVGAYEMKDILFYLFAFDLFSWWWWYLVLTAMLLAQRIQKHVKCLLQKNIHKNNVCLYLNTFSCLFDSSSQTSHSAN